MWCEACHRPRRVVGGGTLQISLHALQHGQPDAEGGAGYRGGNVKGKRRQLRRVTGSGGGVTGVTRGERVEVDVGSQHRTAGSSNLRGNTRQQTTW